MTLPADVKVLAVVVVRDGQLPVGARETVAEAGGAVADRRIGDRQGG